MRKSPSIYDKDLLMPVIFPSHPFFYTYPQVLLTLTGLPTNSSNISFTIQDSTTNGLSAADVLSIQQLSAPCAAVGTFFPDCGRAVAWISLPTQPAPGTFQLIVNSFRAPAQTTVALTYTAACDYDALCGSGKAIDMQLAMAEAIVRCNPAVCVEPAAVPDPVIVAVSPSIGSAMGGTVVEVRFAQSVLSPRWYRASLGCPLISHLMCTHMLTSGLQCCPAPRPPPSNLGFEYLSWECERICDAGLVACSV
jgi:hypothetical protein